MLTHVVMFKLKEPTAERLDEAVRVLRSTEGKVPSLRRLAVGTDVLQTPRSYDVVLIAEFDDRAGLAAYAIHPVHQDVLAYVETNVDARIAVDFES